MLDAEDLQEGRERMMMITVTFCELINKERGHKNRMIKDIIKVTLHILSAKLYKSVLKADFTSYKL